LLLQGKGVMETHWLLGFQATGAPCDGPPTKRNIAFA